MTQSDGSKVDIVKALDGMAGVNLDEPTVDDLPRIFKVYLQEKQARELAEAERDSLISSLFFAKNQRDNFELNVRSLEEEVACLRSVLSEVHEPDGFDHYTQWHRANELAENRKKTD